jgi:hypothetical protein
MVGLDLWYHPIEEDVYFITGLSRRGEYFHHFPALPPSVVRKAQLAYARDMSVCMFIPLWSSWFMVVSCG